MCNRIMATDPRDKNDCNHISLHPDRPEKFLKEQKCMLHSKLWQPIWDNLSVTEMQENYCGAAQIPAELRNPALAAGSLTPHQLKIQYVLGRSCESAEIDAQIYFSCNFYLCASIGNISQLCTATEWQLENKRKARTTNITWVFSFPFLLLRVELRALFAYF